MMFSHLTWKEKDVELVSFRWQQDKKGSCQTRKYEERREGLLVATIFHPFGFQQINR